jgi:hypothetical protein
MSTRSWSVVLFACVALGGCGGSDPAAETKRPQRFFGLNAQLLQPLPTVGRDDDLELHARELASLGVDFARANLDWRIIEPGPPGRGGHRYDFATTDAWVAALARNGLRWQVTGQGGPTPAWARSTADEAVGCTFIAPPANPREFAALMAAVANRYGRRGTFWRAHPQLPRKPIRQYEIWNEPNFANFWCPRPDPEAYGPLYASSRRAIHRVDGRAEVLFGGLAAFRAGESSTPEQMPADLFLERALAAMRPGGRKVDVLAVHPYGQTPDEVLETLGWFRELADAAGLDQVPLSVNEVGWRTSGQGPAPLADEATRAENVRAIVPAIASSSCDVLAVALHTWITPEQDPVDPEHWYGLADPASAEPYPTGRAYGDAVESITAGEATEGDPPADPCA